MTRKRRFIVLLLLLAPALAAAGQEPSRALDWIHDGKFDEADRWLERFSDEDPEVLFLGAFTTYWRLLYDSENESLRRQLHDRLAATIERADTLAEGEATRRTGLAWGGNGRLLRAQLLLLEEHTLRAAYEAKRAKRLLDAAEKAGWSPAETAFGQGTFNYYASQMPKIVKRLRFILALPAGSRDEGLRQLALAAEHSEGFSVEARILLIRILSGSREREFDVALAWARDSQERSVALDHAVGLLELSLDRADAAADRLGRAAARAHQMGADPSVIAALDYQRARASIALFRPDVSLDLLRPWLAGSKTPPASTLEVMRRLAAEAATWTVPPGWVREQGLLQARKKGVSSFTEIRSMRETMARAQEALGHEARGELVAARTELERAAQDHPDARGLTLLLGRIRLLSGDATGALASLRRIADGDGLPPPWQGRGNLLAGQAADLVGDRTRAVDYYRRAQRAGPFLGRDAAYHYEVRPYRRSAP